MKSRWSLVFVAVGAVAICIVAVSRGAPRKSGAAEESSATPDDVSAQLAELRAEVAGLKRKAAMGAPTIVVAPAAPQEDSAPPTTLEDLAKVQARSVDRASGAMERRLSEEAIDAEWSGQTVEKVRSIFRDRVPGAQALDARCGSTVCKVTVSHADLKSQTGMALVLATLDPFRTSTLYRYHADTVPPTTDVYFIREGSTPPPPVQ